MLAVMALHSQNYMILFWAPCEKYRIQKQYYYTTDFFWPHFLSIFALDFRTPLEIDFHPPHNKIYPL